MSPVLPLPDPIAPAAPAAVFGILLDLTFLLHLVAMNLLLGGALLLLGLRLGRSAKGAAHREALARALEKALPVTMAATVTLGVAPLLFLQALHGRIFFTSAIVMAWPWLAIVPLAILAYYGAYALALRPEARPPRRWLGVAVAALLATVAFLQVTMATRSLRLETLRDAHLLDPRGRLLSLGDPTFWPRYLHVVLGAVAVAALATAVLGRRWRTSFPARAQWIVKRSLALFALATAGNVFVGLALLVALPKPVLIRLVGGGTSWSVGLLAASLLLAVALAGATLLSLGARRRDAAVLGLSAMLVATLVGMVLLRDELRRITIANAALEPPPAAVPQWGAVALFLAFLGVGAAAIGWMVRSLVSARAVVPLLALAVLASAGCQRAPARPEAGGSGRSSTRAPAHYPLKGRVVEVDRANRRVTVAHDDIEGFMPAMTMEFAVRQKDAVLLDHVDPGDEITATLAVADSRTWIESLVVVKKGEVAPEETAGREVRPGEAVPDVALVDQDGHELRLSELAGRAYAVTFVYTRCPLPDYCPLMMKNFAAVEAALVADPRLRERTRLLTVSFDPENDTPAVLRRYGRPFQKTKPPFTHWTLATGKDDAIRSLGAALGLDYEEQTGTFIHNLRTAVVDPRGRLVRLLHGNEWKADELVDALRKAASPPSPAAPPG